MNWPSDFINKIICGDCLETMKQIPAETIDMAMTSPPYWGLRDYGFEQIFGGKADCKHRWSLNPKEHDSLRYRGHNANVGSNRNPEIHKGKEKSGGRDCIYCGAWKGQLGLEPTPEIYIEHLTEIFNEIKRVLKKEGTLWLNIGDTYSGSNCGSCDYREKDGLGSKPQIRYKGQKAGKTNLPAKCFLMIPERLAWALIQDGWILRNKIIWHKPNAMPSSVKDRFSNRWEYIFLFSKNQHYYFDLDAVRAPYTEPLNRWGGPILDIPKKTKWKSDDEKAKWAMSVRIRQSRPSPAGKNPGDLFEINTQSFPDAHFAVFPEKLCEKPIKAGCPKEICKECGKARERIIKPTNDYKKYLGKAWHDHEFDGEKGQRIERKVDRAEYETVGWTSCKCKAGFEPGIVIDPFAGAGTVGVVAKSNGRRFILIDIKKEYINMAKRRVTKVGHQKELFEK